MSFFHFLVIAEGGSIHQESETAKESVTMSTRRFPFTLVLSILLAATVCGCAASAPDEARGPAQPHELNRADAIAMRQKLLGDGYNAILK